MIDPTHEMTPVDDVFDASIFCGDPHDSDDEGSEWDDGDEDDDVVENGDVTTDGSRTASVGVTTHRLHLAITQQE